MDAQVVVAIGALAVSLGNAVWQAWETHRRAEGERAQALRQQELETEQSRLQAELTIIERTRFEQEQQRQRTARVVVSPEAVPTRGVLRPSGGPNRWVHPLRPPLLLAQSSTRAGRVSWCRLQANAALTAVHEKCRFSGWVG